MRVIYAPSAARQLEKLPPSLQRRLADKIDFFVSQPDPLAFSKPLTGHDTYRFRVGSYRIVFDISQGTVTILIIDKRADVYRGV